MERRDIESDEQKIAEFKADLEEWARLHKLKITNIKGWTDIKIAWMALNDRKCACDPDNRKCPCHKGLDEIDRELFDGKCIVCEENRLPALQSHHINPDIKVHRWSEISRNWSIKEIVENYIIKEEIVFICGNCHAMESSKNFENNVEEILGENFVKEIQDDYDRIYESIAKHSERIRKFKKGDINPQIVDYLSED